MTKLNERCYLYSVTNYSASDINTCIQLQLNCEYHNSAFRVDSVYQFIKNKYICLILQNGVNNCSYLYVPYQRGTADEPSASQKIFCPLLLGRYQAVHNMQWERL